MLKDKEYNYHSEICPVCKGSGRYYKYNYPIEHTTTQTYIEKTCYGCNGKGWVEVKN